MSDELDDWSEITVEIPAAATAEDVDRIFVAVAEAAERAQPDDRNWDVFIHGHGPRAVRDAAIRSAEDNA